MSVHIITGGGRWETCNNADSWASCHVCKCRDQGFAFVKATSPLVGDYCVILKLVNYCSMECYVTLRKRSKILGGTFD